MPLPLWVLTFNCPRCRTTNGSSAYWSSNNPILSHFHLFIIQFYLLHYSIHCFLNRFKFCDLQLSVPSSKVYTTTSISSWLVCDLSEQTPVTLGPAAVSHLLASNSKKAAVSSGWFTALATAFPHAYCGWLSFLLRRLPYFGISRRMALVRTDVSERCVASIIKVTRIDELGMLAVTSNRSTLRRNITRATRLNIPEDGFLHSHRRENLKSYTSFFFLVSSTVCPLFPPYLKSSAWQLKQSNPSFNPMGIETEFSHVLWVVWLNIRGLWIDKWISIYCHVCQVCVVVWLITLRRGFGFDTGFIHYADL
jgi:hypothetical protein